MANQADTTQGNTTENTVTIDSGSDAGAKSSKVVADVCDIVTAEGIEGVVAPVVVDRPEAGDSYSLLIQPGKEYFLDFEQNQVESMVQQDGNLTITLKDGGSIVLQNFISATNNADLPAEVAFRDPFALTDFDVQVVDTTPDQDELVEPQAELREVVQDVTPEDVSVAKIEPAAGEDAAQKLAQIEPAAGDDGAGGASNSGYGFESSFDPQGVTPINDVGPIGPTALRYGVEFRNDELIIDEQPQPRDDSPIIASPGSLFLDETNLNGANQFLSGTVPVDFGNDAAGATIAPNDVFVEGGSLLGGNLTSSGDDIAVTVNAAGDGYVGTTTGGIIVFDLIIDSETGDYTFTQYQQIDHADATNPNDEITLEFGIIATDGSGDQATTSVVVTIADDAPVLADSDLGTIDEAGLKGGASVTVTGDLVEDSGEDTPADITTTDTFTASGDLDGGVLSYNGDTIDVTSTPTGYVGTTTGGIVVFELTITDQTTGAYEFTLHHGLDHSNPGDIINLDFGVLITDFDGDTDPATITVNVKDDQPKIPENEVPTIGQGYEVVDETNLAPTTQVNGAVTFDFGGDAPGTFGATGNYTVPAGLTSHGVPVTVDFDPATGTYTGTAGGANVFTLVVQDNGTYTFTLIGPIDHPDATDPDDALQLTFEVSVTDTDGDSDTSNIVIDVRDDGPVIADDNLGTINEDSLNGGSVTVNGDLSEDFGGDGEGEITTADIDGLTTGFQATGLTGGTLSSGGEEIIVTSTATGYVGTTTGGIVVFELSITDQSTGAYEFTLHQPLDHADDGDNNPANDIISLNFGVEITDYDGDTDPATITVNVLDSGPSIPGGDKPAINQGQETVDETDLGTPATVQTGNVPFDYGDDGAGEFGATGGFDIAGLQSEGQPIVVDFDDVTGTYTATSHGETIFTLVVESNGDYTFELLGTVDHPNTADHNDSVQLSFDVAVTDSDGDAATGKILINVLDDGPTAVNDTVVFDQKDNSASGNVTDNDDFSNDDFAAGPDNQVTEVTFGGNTVSVPTDGTSTTIEGNFGTLEISNDGEYTYTLKPGAFTGETVSLDPVASDVDGNQTSFTKNGITVSIGDVRPGSSITDGGDLKWKDSGPEGAGIGIGSNGSGDNKVWPQGEVLNVDPAQAAQNVVLTFADIGSNNIGHPLSVEVYLQGNAVPVELTFNVPNPAPANGIWEITLDASDFGGQEIDHINLFNEPGDGSVSFMLNNVQVTYPDCGCGKDEFEYTLTDGDGDTDTAILSVECDPNDVPAVTVKPLIVDETDITDTDSNVITADFGGDAPGTFSGEGEASVNLNGLTSEGQPIVVTYDSATQTYTGTSHGETIFTFAVTTAGAYTFTLLGNVDHADATNPNDAVQISFGVQAEDADGDITTADVNVTILDDGPSIQASQFTAVDESNLDNGPLVVNDTLVHDFGQDGAGEIRPTGNFTTLFQMGGAAQTLTSNGVPVDVDVIGGSYVGTVNGQPVFTLEVRNDGSYTYTQTAAIDHPDSTNPDDVIWLKFQVEIVDGDGDSETAIIGIDVHDDGPVAHNDTVQYDNVDGQATGNVVANDDLSEDAPNTVTKIAFEGNEVDVPQDGTSVTINGDNGTLEISANGDYTYTANGGASGGTTATFDPVQANANGIQETLTLDGITVTVANAGNFDLTWVNTTDGSGLGIDNLNTGDSPKIWPAGESLDIAGAQDVQTMTITLADIGSNNNNGEYGADLIITLADGSHVTTEVQFAPAQINNGEFTFTLDSADYGQLINSVNLASTNDGQYCAASLLLNEVEVTYPGCSDCAEDQFVYTLTDADGDSSTATLDVECNVVDPVFIVGENVDDVSGSNTPWAVGTGDGEIIGSAANDILVGDAGGSSVEQTTQDYNVVLNLDVSGSMGVNDPNDGVTSKVELLIESVNNLLADFGAYQSGDIKVHIVPFSTTAQTAATFMVTDATGLADATEFVDALSGNGWTNYESALQSSIDWLQSTDPIGGNAKTITYFVTDGEPNRYLDDNGDLIENDSAALAMDQIDGTSDSTNEIALIQSLSDQVIGVGINIGGSIVNVDAIDSDGNALNVINPADLNAALQETNPINNLSSVGDDHITGGNGDDIIFGDVLFTDDLAADQGLHLNLGSGWEVFAKLENGEGNTSDWDRADTISYIENNALALSEESVTSQGDTRHGGDDVLRGGDGNDLIFGQEGHDVIVGGAGDDTLFGGSGADVFLFEAIADGVDTIKDFVAGEDVLDISGLLQGYDAVQDSINDFVFATEANDNTTISVDVDGSAGPASAVNLVVLEGVTGLDITEITHDGLSSAVV